MPPGRATSLSMLASIAAKKFRTSFGNVENGASTKLFSHDLD